MKDVLSVMLHSDATLPSLEVMLLLTILTLCLLFKTNKIGLVASYIFAYRWGWLIFEKSFGHDLTYMYGYMGFGFLALIFAVIGMFRTYNP